MGRLRRPAGAGLAGALGWLASQPPVTRQLYRGLQGARSGGHRDARRERLEFLAFCATHRSGAQAQLFQDLWVLYETGQRRGGYFVEFGAVDGLAHSNTRLLERDYGWHGILAEPNPAMEVPLRQNRTAEIDLRCVLTASRQRVELLVPADPYYATVPAQAVPDASTAMREATGHRVPVDTVSLHDLLEEHQAPDFIDYLSIDTEGTELEILLAYGFRQRRIGLLTVEHNYRDDQGQLDRLVAEHGYERRFPELSEFDAWYRLVAGR